MVDFKAGFDAWRKIGLRQQQNEHYASALIELKQRVKALEDDSNEQSISMHFCFESIIKRLEALEDLQQKPEPISATVGSLVERVRKVIKHEFDNNARAAIREVAAWLRASTDLSHGPRVADWLEQEADRG